MSNYLQEGNEVKVQIPEVINEDGVTLYRITIQVGDVLWGVYHRYSDFAALHEKLVEQGVEREILPPKKLIGNKDPSFIMKRRRELETYIQSVYRFLSQDLPASLAKFLEFDKYDMNFISRSLASFCHDQVEVDDDAPDGAASQQRWSASWSPLEMHCISERLTTPCPPLDPESKRLDFTNVADFCCRLENLNLSGSEERLGSSTIVPNQLPFNFSAFKALSRLHIDNIKLDADKIQSLGLVRKSLTELSVSNCGLKSLSDVLLCDTNHSAEDCQTLLQNEALKWPSLVVLDASHNEIDSIDNYIRLANKISTLRLDSNNISSIENLTGLPYLRRLSLARNKIIKLQELHLILGQVTHLDLSHNRVRTLHCFTRLYSLQALILASNKINDLEEVYPICALPCLEELDLRGNEVTDSVDYRLKVFESIGSRCGEVALDGVKPSSPELDKVSVMMALRVAKEKRSPMTLFGKLPNSEKVPIN